MDRSRTYKIQVPANPPMMDFWSIIAYSTASRTFIDSPKITVSSNEEDIRVNGDGSIGFCIGPKPVEGYEANTVVNNPDEDSFLMFRLCGAKPELWGRKWQPANPELVK